MSGLLHSALHSGSHGNIAGLAGMTPIPSGAQTPPVPYSRPTTPGSGHAIQIGFVGIGALGAPMARNMANYRAAHAHGSPAILIWNRSSSKCDALLNELGPGKIRVAQTLEQVATECDMIITNLANDEVVKSVFQQLTETLKHAPPPRSKIFVETSTIYPSVAAELDILVHSIPHCRLITSPVFGTPHVAASAQLVIVMSGDYRSKKEAAHTLVPAVGRKVIDLGGNLEKAPTFKLIGNSMILGTLEIFAESYTLAEKSGIAQQEVHNLVKELFPAPGLIRYSERMSQSNFDGSTGFSIDGGIKDASHIRRLTAVHNAPMPSIDIAHQHLITARAIHNSRIQAGKDTVDVLDWSGIVAGTRVAAGLDGFEVRAGVVQEE